jgi:hypothetical protein
MTEFRSLLSTLSIDPMASLGFCPMRGSDGLRLVFERSLLLLVKLSVAPRSKAPLVVTSGSNISAVEIAAPGAAPGSTAPEFGIGVSDPEARANEAVGEARTSNIKAILITLLGIESSTKTSHANEVGTQPVFFISPHALLK